MMRPAIAHRRISRWDIAVSVALTALSQLELASQGRFALLPVTISLVITGTLVFRTAAPLLTTLVVLAAFASQVLLTHGEPGVLGNGLSLMVAFYATAKLGPLRSAPLLLLGALVMVVFEDSQGNVGAAAGDMVMYLAAWAAGLLVERRRRETAARLTVADEELQRAEERAEAALTAERQRVARELHDVVSHAITVVVLQARGAAAVLDQQPERAREALTAIEVSGQEALAEMRRLVTFLREDPGSEPQPDLGDIPTLVETARREVPVELQMDVDPGLLVGRGVGLTAYRLVQECLTNAMRHAPGAEVDVSVRGTPDELVIQVSNPITGDAGQPGFGLAGMRERTRLYGGTLEYGERNGLWRVHCRLPVSAKTESVSANGGPA